MEAVRGRLFLWYEGCMIQESYCCAVGIGQQAQAQCNRLAFRVLTQGLTLQISIGWLAVIASVIPLALIGFYL